MRAFFSPQFSWDNLTPEYTRVICTRVRSCLHTYSSTGLNKEHRNAAQFRKATVEKVCSFPLPWLLDKELPVPDTLTTVGATALRRLVLICAEQPMAVFPEGFFLEKSLHPDIDRDSLQLCLDAYRDGVAFCKDPETAAQLEACVFFHILRVTTPPVTAALETTQHGLRLTLTCSGRSYTVRLHRTGLQVYYNNDCIGKLPFENDMITTFLQLIHPVF